MFADDDGDKSYIYNYKSKKKKDNKEDRRKY